MHKSHHHTGLPSPVFFCALLLTLAFLSLSAVAHAQAMLLPTTTLKVGPHAVQAEVAATDASRTQGLMNRTSLPRDHGMLFVFARADTPCFWMKNTPLPLSIAFISADGTIVNIADMQPHSLAPHCPAAPIVYALEMEQGWFSRHQVKAGATVVGLPQ